MGLKYSIDFIVAISKILYFYSLKKCDSLPRIFEKVHITAKIQKTQFDKYATGRVRAFCIKFIYLIQFIMEQNYHKSC